MEINIPGLSCAEAMALRLRALYEENGYRIYRMGSFEEYDLYMQNKTFLAGEDVITFNAADGRLMALKPDVTLSIVKNTPVGEARRLYYNESVFRRSRRTGEYREINQMGVEYLGGSGLEAEAGVLALAARSLSLAGNYALDLSHMELLEAALRPFAADEGARERALEALRAKSPHAMREVAEAAGLAEETTRRLQELATLNGPFAEAMARARVLAAGFAGMDGALDELEALYTRLAKSGNGHIRLDFSIIQDISYYNGLIFQGYLEGLPYPVLAGGRYDHLLTRFGKGQGALGFAIYLDELDRAAEKKVEGLGGADTDDYLNIALPKGRLGDKVYALFARAGLSCAGILDESRRLVFEDAASRVRYFLVKPSDVDIYVEHGAADIGVVGRDVLLESGADVLELFDLGLGKCRLAVAAMNSFEENMALPLRVATKYPAVARRYYASQSRDVEIIRLHGSIELAPILGLSDVIVDIVETGSTLRENDLHVLCEIEPSSARLIANRSAWRFKGRRIQGLVERLGEVL